MQFEKCRGGAWAAFAWLLNVLPHHPPCPLPPEIFFFLPIFNVCVGEVPRLKGFHRPFIPLVKALNSSGRHVDKIWGCLSLLVELHGQR